MTDRTEPSAAELRQLLAVVLEAIAIPHPKTVGDAEAHREVLADRAMDAVVALDGVLHRGDDPGWSADYLRTRLAEKPTTGYRAWGDAERPAENVPDDQAADEREQARQSVDRAFPAVAEFLADERARKDGEDR